MWLFGAALILQTSRNNCWRRCSIQNVLIVDFIYSKPFEIKTSLSFNCISNLSVILMTSSIGSQFSQYVQFWWPYFWYNCQTSIFLSSLRDSNCLHPIRPNLEVLSQFSKSRSVKQIILWYQDCWVKYIENCSEKKVEVRILSRPIGWIYHKKTERKNHQGPLGKPITKQLEQVCVNNTWYSSWKLRQKYSLLRNHILIIIKSEYFKEEKFVSESLGGPL